MGRGGGSGERRNPALALSLTQSGPHIKKPLDSTQEPKHRAPSETRANQSSVDTSQGVRTKYQDSTLHFF